jgi:hypothetical protein
MRAADSNSGLTDADAATVWALDKIRATAKTGGQLEITNRVARYLGAIQGGTEMSKEELDAAIAAQENEIKTLISNARTQAEKNLIACIEQQNPSCAECQLKAKENLISSTSSLEQVQRGLALAVQKADTVAMVNKFKGKAGDIDFSLDNITRGSVQKDPSRLKGFDACGTPVVHSTRTSSNSSSGNLPQDYNCVNGQCLNSNGQSYVSTGDGVVYDNGTSPESSVTQYNPYAYNLETYKAEADATYVAPRYTVPTGQPFVVIGKGASAAGAAMTKITQMVKTPDGCAKLGGIWSQPNNRCEVKDLKTGKSYGKALVLGSSTTAKVMAKIAQMVKTPSGCIQAGGVWSKQNKRCEAPATYQAFYDRDPLIKSVKDFMIPVVKTVVQANYTIAKKTYQTTKDYVLPTLGQMALFPYNVAVKTTKTVVNATKRNPAATKSIVTNSLIPGWNLYYYASPWGFAYDAYKMMK